MKRVATNVIFTIALILLSVYFFGEDVNNVLIEVGIFYGIMAIIFVVLVFSIGWGITKAMTRKKD